VLVGSTEHFLLPSPSRFRNQEGEGNGFIAATSVFAASVTSVVNHPVHFARTRSNCTVRSDSPSRVIAADVGA
jgi:hypothetical protein